MRQVIVAFLVMNAVVATAGDSPLPKSRVALAHDPLSVNLFQADPSRVAVMLEKSMCALTGESTSAAAWRKFVQPTDVVGIKIATTGGPLLSTHSALIDAVVAQLRQAGVPADQIIVWDRFARDMTQAGVPLRNEAGSVRYLATTPDTGSDESIFYQSGFVAKPHWGDFDFGRMEVSDRSYLSNIVTKRVTKIINIPTATDHRDAGIAGCLFNLAIGSADNTRRFAASPWFYDPAVAEISAMDTLRDKAVLHILDALVPQFAGGPSAQPRFCWHAGAIYVSTDPVAIDTLILAEIESRRAQHGFPKIGDRARHIASGAELELGINKRELIEVVSPIKH